MGGNDVDREVLAVDRFSPEVGQSEWDNSPESDPNWVRSGGAGWGPDDHWDTLADRLGETLDEYDTSNAVQIVRDWIGAAVEAGVRATRGDAATPTEVEWGVRVADGAPREMRDGLAARTEAASLNALFESDDWHVVQRTVSEWREVN